MSAPAYGKAGSESADGVGIDQTGAEGAATQRLERGEALELEVQSLAHGGEGVARLALADIPHHGSSHNGDKVGDGGYVVFVSGAIPGDRVRAEVVKRKRSYAHARAVEILRESPERIPPRAHHPGVAWQVLPYARQLEVKQQQVDDALRRIGGLDGFELEPIVPAVEQWRYRNKLEYSFGHMPVDSQAGSGRAPQAGPDGRARSAGELVCGFHAPGGWKRVEPIEDCLLASEQGNRARQAALAWSREQGLRAWDRHRESIAAGAPLLRNLVVREGRRTGHLQVRLISTPGELDAGSFAQALVRELGEQALAGVLWTRSDALAETTLGRDTELVWGEPDLPERLGALDLRISAQAFFQTNTEMAETLYGVAGEYAQLQGWERVFDLYCGIGTIALALAPRAGEVWGIELIEDAVADAIAAAACNEITNARFFAGDARLALPELLARAGRPDVVVVDPPRAGLSQKVVRRIVDASPKRVVYVSCNPTTLAPNAAQLVDAGWRLVKVRPVDMFPQTPHIECVALLERS